MARLPLTSSLAVLLTVLITPILSDPVPPYGVVCPTVTKTTSRPSCPTPTPAFCPQPDCILLSTIYNPCGCPTSVSTWTSYSACPTACHGACGTAYETIHECASATVSSITPSPTPNTGCVTVTDTAGGVCPTLSHCATPDCVVLSTVTQNCGCSEIFHETKCKTKCDGACSTDYVTLHIPCPYTGPFTTVNGTVMPG